MQMAFLQAQIQFPKSPSDYKKSVFSFDTSQFHPIDHMDMHRQTGEMLFFVMKPANKKIEKIDECLRNKPLRWGNLHYITQINNSWMIQMTRPSFYI